MVDVCALPSRAVFRLLGEGVRAWLQGLITNDIERLDESGALYTALLTPQGKILFDFFLYPQGEDLLVDCDGEQKDALMKRLRLYKLRSPITFADEPQIGVVSSCTPLAEADFIVVTGPDPRHEKLGVRILGDVARITAAIEAQGVAPQDEAIYHDYLHGIGIASRPQDFPTDKAYPLECNFAEMNGVSFKKGCFIGQEVTARLKHKSTLSRRLLPVLLQETAEGPSEEVDIVSSDGKKIGTLQPGPGARRLALVRLKELGEAREREATFEAGGARLEISEPDWLGNP